MKKSKYTFICLLVALLASATICRADQKDFTYQVRTVTTTSFHTSTTTSTADLSGTTFGTLTEGAGSQWSIDSTGALQILFNFTGKTTGLTSFIFIGKDKNGNTLFSMAPIILPPLKGNHLTKGTAGAIDLTTLGSLVQTIITH